MALGKAYGKGGQTFAGLRIWQYQDFTAPVSTGVTLTAHGNGTGLDFVASEIVDGSAVATLSSDPESPVTTVIDAATVGDPANRVVVSAHTGASVTLDQTPHSSLDVRVWYLVEVPKDKGLPENYQEAPKFVRSALTDFMDATYVNNFGDETVRGDKTFLGDVSLPRQVIAGANMTGGGALTGDVTLNSDLSSVVPTLRTVSAGSGLSGGGALSGNIILSLASGAIAQGDLKTTTETKTITPTPTSINTTLASTYTLGSDHKKSSAGAQNFNVLQASTINFVGNAQAFDLSTSFTNHLMMSYATTSQTFSSRIRYVQASPPYDLGDGEVPLFIFLAMKADGTIGHASIAEDPPWAGNGPTNIMPDFTDPKTGKNFKVMPKGPLFTLEEIRADPGKREQHLDSLRLAQEDGDVRLVEITHEMKNADMALFPHPLVGQSDDGPALVKVLIDPMSKEAEELYLLNRAGEDIGKIIQDYWTIGNVGLSRAGPPGVMVVRGLWKP